MTLVEDQMMLGGGVCGFSHLPPLVVVVGCIALHLWSQTERQRIEPLCRRLHLPLAPLHPASRLGSARLGSAKMATDGAAPGGIRTKCDFNIDNLSKPELLTLLSIMEGELEARDLVIETLRARKKEVFIQEHYGQFNLSDPFLALQRDYEAGGGDKERQAVCSSALSILEAVMAQCRKMQERVSAQLVAAESRQKKLEQEKQQLQSLEEEHRKLSAQLKDERQKNKHVVMLLVRECKQLSSRVAEESLRFEELSARLEEELSTERRRGQQMEAEMEKQLADMDTDRERLRARLGREEACSAELRAQSDCLRQQVEELQADKDAGRTPPGSRPETSVSVGVLTEPPARAQASCQTEHAMDGPKKVPLSVPVKPSVTGYASVGLPKSQNPLRSVAENGLSSSPGAGPALPTGASPRVQAARYKFQSTPTEQDQNGNATPSPPSRDVSPTSRDNFAAKQQARHTVTQVLSRFTSPPAAGALRPSLPHSASEGGPFPGRLNHPQMGLKSPSVGRIDRGNPPPIPPKKPGLSQTPSPPHPPVKVVGEASRSSGTSLGVSSKPATPQLPPKPAVALGGTGTSCPIPGLTASQAGVSP